jgi:hypothetical protein
MQTMIHGRKRRPDLRSGRPRGKWREFCGPPVDRASKHGLGTRLLEQAVPGADTELLFEPVGFVYRLCLSRVVIADS